jgi:hypothetical protein
MALTLPNCGVAVTVVLNGGRYGHHIASLYGLHITDILIYNKPFSQ